ncbi:MAG: ATP-binding protein [Pseudomonadota bacterium]
MDTRPIRISLAVIATGLLVGVLSLLIVESRTVTTDYHVAHAERIRTLDAVQADVAAVRAGAQTALTDGQSVPLAVDLALARVAENRAALATIADIPRAGIDLTAEAERLDAALTGVSSAAATFVEHQAALAASLATFQSESPTLVKYLRDQDATVTSQQVFRTAIDVFELATADDNDGAALLTTRIDALSSRLESDEFAAPQVAAFSSAATAVVADHGTTLTNLDALLAAAAEANPRPLQAALTALDRTLVSRVERARLLLAVCAVLLLAAAAYAIARLQSSYRELNTANQTLEENVAERTAQLTKAIDDLKESQVQLIHAEKMSSLGEMVAGISHEINTPLWYLMNNSSVLQDRLAVVGELCDVADEMLAAARSKTDVNERVGRGLVTLNRLMNDGIRDDIEEAKDLIQDNIDGLDDLTALAQGLKDFSRLDRAQQGEFNVNEGLERTLLIAKNRLKEKATVHKHYGDIPAIYCTPSQINQVFLNLLTNAADAIGDHGDIVVHTCEQDGNVEISISDTGCGIAQSALEKIRDPFFTTKEVGQGTGLGLSIVDRIVSEHEGELRIESEPGKGTTVTVSLPIGAALLPTLETDGEHIDLSLDENLLHAHTTAVNQPAHNTLPA